MSSRRTELAPSREEGACDAATIDWAVPYFDPVAPGVGAIAHTCIPDDSTDSFVVVQRFAVER